MSFVNVTTNNLTASSKTAQTRNYVWHDTSDSDVSLNQRVLVSNNDGLMSLSSVSANEWKAESIPMIDELFQDVDGDDFYQSYLTNYKNLTMTSANLDLVTAYTSSGDVNQVIAVTEVTRNAADLVFNLNNLVGQTADQSEDVKVTMSTNLDFLPSANVTDVSNTLTVKMHNFGTDNLAGNHEFTYNTPGTITLEANALTDNAKLVFSSDATANDSEFDSIPKPSLLLANLLNAEYALSAGHRTVTIPVSPPANAGTHSGSGAWNWKAKIVDGSYESAEVNVRIVVNPSLSAPVPTGSFSAFDSNSTDFQDITFKYAVSDLNNLSLDAANVYMEITAEITGSSNFSVSSTAGGNMATTRTADSSHTFRVTHNVASEYSATNDSATLTVKYRQQGTSAAYKILTYNLSSTGAHAYTPVTVTNNFNGTYTLAGGNMRTDNIYVTSPSGAQGSWVAVGGATYTATAAGTRYFAVAKSSSSPLNAYVASMSVATEVDNTALSIALGVNSASFNSQTTTIPAIVQVDENGVVTSTNASTSSTSYTLIADNSYDLNIAMTKPNWFDNESMQLKVTIREEPVAPGTRFNLASYDISTAYGVHTGFMPTTGSGSRQYILAIDASSNEQFDDAKLNLTFNAERYNKSTLAITAALYRNGTQVVSSSNNYLITGTVNSNTGGNIHNIVMLNRSKVNLTRTSGTMTALTALTAENDVDVSATSLGAIGANSFRNLASNPDQMLYVNVARSDYVGPNHVFDVSGFNVSVANGNGREGEIKVYLPHASYPGFDLGSLSAGTGYFSNYADIFVDVGYYTGAIDITYSTIFEGDYSATTNTMRLLVLPRPNITFSATNGSDNHNDYNTPSFINMSVANRQVDGESAVVTLSSSQSVLNVGSGSTNVDALLARYTEIKRNGGAVPTVTSVGSETASILPDGTNVPSLFSSTTDLPESVAYNVPPASAGLRFAGLNLDSNAASDLSGFHMLTFNAAINYNRHARFSNRALAINDDFVITVVDDNDREYAAELMANQLYLNNGISINGLDFLKYIRTESHIDLDVYPKVENMYVENIGNNDITVNASGGMVEQTLTRGQRAFFRRNNGSWSYVRDVNNTLYSA
jgi:heat shock protein HslJ